MIDIQRRLLRVTQLHFLYVAAIVVQIIMYDAWKVITPQVLLQRWFVAVILLVVATVVWGTLKRGRLTKATYYRAAYALIAADIFVATYAIYAQRGMASRAVFLFVIPIITAAALANRATVIGAALLSIAAYATAAITYFVLNFNEGYKIELYGEVGFYAAMLAVVAALVWAVAQPKKKP